MRYLRWAALLLGAPLAAAYLSTTLWQLFGPQPPEQVLPALTVNALDGHSERLELTNGLPTVIHLWTTDCGACAGEFELLVGAARSARYGGFRYLFINQGDNEAAIRRYLTSNGLSEVAPSVYLDPVSSVYDALGANGLPGSYFFRKDGTLHEARGIITRTDLLVHTLEPLLGRP